MDDEKALLFIREEIDAIDSEIIALLESRSSLPSRAEPRDPH